MTENAEQNKTSNNIPDYLKDCGFILACLCTLLLLSTFSSSLSAKLPEAPSLFKEWVTTERIISKEVSNWDTEKEAIGDLIELLEEEILNIDEKLNSIEEKNTEGEEERIKLADQNEELKESLLPITSTLEFLEPKILDLSERFPPPLQDDLKSFLNRIQEGSSPKANLPSTSQRLQAIVGALAKIDKFNSSIAVDEKLLSVDGVETKVMVIYFGLGIAYFSDETGTLAGYMLPEGSGWENYDYPTAGTAIIEAISFYKRTAQKQASFVNLPFRIKQP